MRLFSRSALSQTRWCVRASICSKHCVNPYLLKTVYILTVCELLSTVQYLLTPNRTYRPPPSSLQKLPLLHQPPKEPPRTKLEELRKTTFVWQCARRYIIYIYILHLSEGGWYIFDSVCCWELSLFDNPIKVKQALSMFSEIYIRRWCVSGWGGGGGIWQFGWVCAEGRVGGWVGYIYHLWRAAGTP